MSGTKYLKSTGRSRWTRLLADDMKTYYKQINLCSIASMTQIQRALLGNGSDFSVICQIAFFLGIQVEELINPTLTMEQIEQEHNTHYMKNSEPKDWIQLDEDTAPILEQLAKDIYTGRASEIGRPERVSARIVYRELNLSWYGFEHNMPKCKAIFDKYTEPYPENWARKIIWAYQKLKEEKDASVNWTDIRNLTGVKKHNFKATIPYLTKHTDKETAASIIKLIGLKEEK
jgi:hypothetical protein